MAMLRRDYKGDSPDMAVVGHRRRSFDSGPDWADSAPPVIYGKCMKSIVGSVVAVLVTMTPFGAAAQPTPERVDGLRRVCTYRSGPLSTQVREYEVAIGEDCPAVYPAFDDKRPTPSTARFQSAQTRQGMRFCTYAQGAGRWTYRLPETKTCPLSAGMAELAGGIPEENND